MYQLGYNVSILGELVPQAELLFTSAILNGMSVLSFPNKQISKLIASIIDSMG